MHYSTWIRIFISSIAVSMIIIVTTNYIVNPYNIFKPNSQTHYNHLKKYIMSDRMTFFYEMQHIQPQTLMVGTSRIGYLKSNNLIAYSQSPIFNLTLAGSSIYEQRRYIEYAIEHLPIKTIVWSLDFFSFNPIKEPYPSFSEDRLNHSIHVDDYMMALLSYRTFERGLKTIKINKKNTHLDKNISAYVEGQVYMDEQGQTLSSAEIHKNALTTLNEYAHHDAFLHPKIFRSPHSIDPKLQEVAYILQLCKEKNIRCVIYTSPVYSEHLDMTYSLGLENTYEYWKRSLADMTDYWDFNTYNSITNNIMNFRDSSHMISSNGKYIFRRLFNDSTNFCPSDFGDYITKENIEHHLNEQKKMVHPFHFNKI